MRTAIRTILRYGLGSAYLAASFLTKQRQRDRAHASRSVPIFNFHRVSTFRLDHWMTIHRDAFGELLIELQRRYRIVSLAEIDEVLASGSNSEDLLGITFDDTYGCNYYHAFPILRELHVPATFFVTTGVIDGDRPLPHDIRKGFYDLPCFTSDQLRIMSATPNIAVGSHTVNHPDFSRPFVNKEMVDELVESRAHLRAITGLEIDRLAIPFGSRAHCSTEMIATARRCGYSRVYANFGGRNAIDRNGVVGDVLHRICELGSPKFVIAMIEGYRGWRSVLAPAHVHTLGPQFHPSVIVGPPPQASAQ